MKTGWGGRRLRSALFAAALGTAVMTGGCVTAHSELGTSNGPCFVALPAALAAVHHRGLLSGVRLLSWAGLQQSAPVRQAVAGLPGPPARVCVVGFVGRFHQDAVAQPSGLRRGRFAVVVLRYPGNAVITTVLGSTAPLHFGHGGLGGG